MGKESKKGHHFYREMGLKLMSLYLPADVRKQLAVIAKRQDRTVQKLVRRVVTDYARKHGALKTG